MSDSIGGRIAANAGSENHHPSMQWVADAETQIPAAPKPSTPPVDPYSMEYPVQDTPLASDINAVAPPPTQGIG